jgi:hypothetical protein
VSNFKTAKFSNLTKTFQPTMRTAGECRSDAIHGMMYIGLNAMRRLFRVLWLQANQEEYEENDERDMLSQSTVDLHEKIRNRGSSPPLMEDWNVQKMCDALDVMLPQGKRVFCMNMRKFGLCRFGGDCHYAHSESELENPKTSRLYKTVLCNVPLCTRKFCAFAHGEAELRFPSAAVTHIPRTRFECLVQDNLVTPENLNKKYLSHFLSVGECVRDAVETVRAIRNILSHTRGDVDVRKLTVATGELLLELLTAAFECMSKEAGGTSLAEFQKERAEMLDEMLGPVRSSKKSPTEVQAAGWTRVEPGNSGIMSWDEAAVEQFFVRCNFPTKGLRDNQIDGGSLVGLFQDKDREKNFCNSVEEGGLGFTKLLFKGRLKKEMMLLGVTFE